jgi:O-succinylbenzoic acid--CoA ligase
VDRPLRDLPADDPHLAGALAAALDGSGPALRVLAPGAATRDEPGAVGPGSAHDEAGAALARSAHDEPHVPEGVAVVLRTSGSTGAPRDVLLSAAALRASGEATLRRIGGPGSWLLVLPPDHVAGLQVLARAALSAAVVHAAPAGPFRASSFAAAVAALPATGRSYTSIVPTQLVRLLDDEAGRVALRTFDAVLLGGSGIPPTLLDDAFDSDVRVVTTYGMTETCGGCVYDGVPLDDVRVRLDDDGRVLLAGPVLADGYLGRPDLDAAAFLVDDEGTRWLRTSDLGTFGPAGRLEILGRADDVIITGGVNVAPGPVEDLLVTLPAVREACVVGVPDDEWGHLVVAVLVVGPTGPPRLADVRALVTSHLGPAAAPRRLVVVPALPTRGPGKPDRHAATALAAGTPDRPR